MARHDDLLSPVARRTLFGERLRVLYAIAARRMHAALRTSARSHANVELVSAALDETRAALAQSERDLGSVATNKVDPVVDERLRAFVVEVFQPSTRVLEAGVLLELELEPASSDLLVERVIPSLLSYRTQYNLGCYFASRARIAGDPRSLPLALDYVGRALRSAPGRRQASLARWSLEDPSLAPLRESQEGAKLRVLVRTTTSPAPGRDR